MPKPDFLILDTKDDRREIHLLLGKLPPVQRVDFLNWCCQRVRSKLKPRPSPKMAPRLAHARRDDAADERFTMEILLDFWMMASQQGFDVVAAVEELEQRVKRLPPK